MAGLNDVREIEEALRAARTVAVVGCSPDPSRPSHSIARYLIRAGYEVIPVNPGHQTLLGTRCYPDLGSIPADVSLDVVDVFRRSDQVAPIADEAIARGGVRLFWMQDGVVDEASARRLIDAGIGVAMDRCIFRDHAALARAPGG